MDVELITCLRSDIVDLVLYTDMAASILKEQGFPGKAEALEARYMKVAKQTGLKSE